MEEVEGKQAGSMLHIFDGYLYYRDRRFAGQTFRCTLRQPGGCSGRVIIGENDDLVLVVNHNHPRDWDLADMYRAKTRMIRLSKSTNDPLKEIFDQVSRE